MKHQLLSKIDHPYRIQRMLASLDGLSTGDAFGERFFGDLNIIKPLIEKQVLPSPPWLYTDDTELQGRP
jgi:hypothetical protein